MENNAYPKIKHAVLLCLLFFGIQLAAGIVFELISFLFGISADSIAYETGLIFIYILSFGVIILISFKKSGKKFNEVFLFKNVSAGIWASVIIFSSGFVIISSEIDNLINYILPMPVFLQEIFDSMLGNNYFVISVISVGILPAFFEEMFFRGIVLGGFRQNYPQTKAILISSLLFGLIHLNPYQFVTAFLIGIVMGYVLIKTDSILPAMYMHLFNNTLFVIVMRIDSGIIIDGFNSAYGGQVFQPWWFNLTGLALAGAGAYLFFWEIRKTKAAEASESA